MSIKLSWTPHFEPDNTRIYRGTSLDKLELKAELKTVIDAPDVWVDTDKLHLGDHFYAVVLGENGVYSEPAVIKVTLQPKVLPATGLKIEIVPDAVPAAPVVDEPIPDRSNDSYSRGVGTPVPVEA